MCRVFNGGDLDMCGAGRRSKITALCDFFLCCIMQVCFPSLSFPRWTSTSTEPNKFPSVRLSSPFRVKNVCPDRALPPVPLLINLQLRSSPPAALVEWLCIVVIIKPANNNYRSKKREPRYILLLYAMPMRTLRTNNPWLYSWC